MTLTLFSSKNPSHERAVPGYLSLWKNGDPDIPILKQAEYAKLQYTSGRVANSRVVVISDCAHNARHGTTDLCHGSQLDWLGAVLVIIILNLIHSVADGIRTHQTGIVVSEDHYRFDVVHPRIEPPIVWGRFCYRF